MRLFQNLFDGLPHELIVKQVQILKINEDTHIVVFSFFRKVANFKAKLKQKLLVINVLELKAFLHETDTSTFAFEFAHNRGNKQILEDLGTQRQLQKVH